MITQARLKELLDYNPITGIFKWVSPPKNKPQLKGNRAGYVIPYGYREINVGNHECYREHTLAFIFMTGSPPDIMVDHSNQVRDDNRWDNLISSNALHNGHNRKDNVNFPGVTQTVTGSWVAKARNAYLGTFKTHIAASMARHQWNIYNA